MIVSFGASGGDDVPALIDGRNGLPVWVSAEHAVDDQGHLRENLFRDFVLSDLRAAARKSQQKCEVAIGRSLHHFKPTSSLNALTSYATEVVSGKIVAGAQGFYDGMPGTLFRISATYLKGRPSLETYFFYPRAKIRTAEGFICATPLGVGSFPDPQPGDRLLWFEMEPPVIFGDRTIAFVDLSRELVHERREGGTRLPQALRSEKQRDFTFRELERSIESQLKGRLQPGIDVP